MPDQKKRIYFTVTALLAFIALITGVFISQYLPTRKQVSTSQFQGTVLDKPREIKPFSLTGTDNQAFTNESLKGQWTMIFFGFTNCGSLCPTTMAKLSKMYWILEKKQIKPLPRVVMISIDPERDHLKKLEHYVKAFEPSFYGARGDGEVVKQMTQEMGIAYTKVALPNSLNKENYDIQHSGAVMLFNPQGQLSAFFTTPHKATLLAKDYQLLVS